MQISYVMVSNAHVRHLTVSLYSGSMFDENREYTIPALRYGVNRKHVKMKLSVSANSSHFI